MIEYERKRWDDYDAIKRVINSNHGIITDYKITQSVDEPVRIDLSIEPYSARIDADTRVRTNYEKLNKACEEINRNLTKSILDKYDLSYIDTDMAATMAATKEEFKNYILEGKKMPIRTGIDYELKGFTFVPVTNKYNVKKIIHSGPCTIVFWEDNTKTIVRLEEGKEYDEYAAFTAALAKKCYGSNSQVHKILETKTVEQKNKKEKETPAHVLQSLIDNINEAFKVVDQKARDTKC